MRAAQDKTTVMQAFERLSLRETLSYSLGDVGVNLYWAPLTAFLMMYLTDVVGLRMADVGIMMVVVRLVGAFAEPLMAALADRTDTHYGRYRVWFLFLAVPMAAIGVLIFATSGTPDNSKLLVTYLCMITFNLIYTAITVPYNALSGVITPDSRQREVLMSVRFGISFLSAVFLTWLTPKVGAFIGVKNMALSWQFAMTVYGVIAFAIFINLFLNTRERFSSDAKPNLNPLQDIRDLFGNRLWVALFVLGFVVMLGFTIHTAATPYFIKYYVGRPDLQTGFAMLFMVGLAVGSSFTSTLTKFVTHRQVIAYTLLAAALTSIGLYLAPPSQLWLIDALQVGCGVALGLVSTLTFSMYGDLADENAWRTGHRATAMTYSIITFAKKLGAAGAAAVVAWAFSLTGYTANTHASPALLDNIRLMMGLTPALLFVAGAAVIVCYDMSAATIGRLPVLGRRLSRLP